MRGVGVVTIGFRQWVLSEDEERERSEEGSPRVEAEYDNEYHGNEFVEFCCEM